MKVNAIVENEKGTFEFTAELSAAQHQFLIEYALRDLVRKGLIPFNEPQNIVEAEPVKHESH